MKLLTFLGVGNYSETAYVWQGEEFVAKYAPTATCHFLQPDEAYVFVTEAAQEGILPQFMLTIPASVDVTPIPVPLGSNAAELWQIFSEVSSATNEGETVAFDITHGLRSFPLIGLLAAAFLRTSRAVTLKAVMYGAWDVRDQSAVPNRTPMFDLSPMISLLEWAIAADRFNRTGDSRYLASLGKAQQNAIEAQAQGDREQLIAAGKIGKLAGALSGVSQALQLIRPHQAMHAIADLPTRIADATPILAERAPAQPLTLLLEQIEATYGVLGLKQPADTDNISANLAKQRTMIGWYAEREQWVQAVTLAREWVVSWMVTQLGHSNILDGDFRHTVENVLGSESRAKRDAKKKHLPFKTAFLASIADAGTVLNLWSMLADIRNDINHAGMRVSPAAPDNLIARIQACMDIINALPVDSHTEK